MASAGMRMLKSTQLCSKRANTAQPASHCVATCVERRRSARTVARSCHTWCATSTINISASGTVYRPRSISNWA